MIKPDPELERQLDDIIDIIAEAQQDDGYLYVSHICKVANRKEMGQRPYSWVVHSHELYNLGHMYEGAIAYYRATGKDKWLQVAQKSAEHFNKVFFEGDPNYNDGKPVMQAPATRNSNWPCANSTGSPENASIWTWPRGSSISAA
jgi:DUF1680 family protein